MLGNHEDVLYLKERNMILENMENVEQNLEDSVHLFDGPVEEQAEDDDMNNF